MVPLLTSLASHTHFSPFSLPLSSHDIEEGSIDCASHTSELSLPSLGIITRAAELFLRERGGNGGPYC